ncbi:MAG TPA: lysylphosphatidylglycerol synthase transmembrane domain-containing protein [Pyrinomonadaceae bacterium]|nr:lysylphosphatidylglycerol synthase transmembrane domain-containing protein [Pyrinomonadaceae bacterium]
MKSNIRKYVEFGALCLLAVVILWWFGRSLNWSEVREAVSHANPYLLALAALVISLSYLFRAARWGALLAPLSPASLKNLFIATTVGFGAVFLVGRAGEVVRPAILPMRDPKIRASASFVTILIERIYDLIAVAILFAANLLWFTPPANSDIEFGRVRIAGLVMLIGTLLGVFALTLYRKKSPRVIGWLKPKIDGRRFVPPRLARAFISILEQLARALRVLVDARELAITVGWTAVVWLSIGVASLLVFRAFGLPFGMSETIFVLGWALVGSLVPTPGGAAGAFHAATAAGLIFLGVPRETAAAVAIVLHLIDFSPAIVFGFIYLVKGDINLSRLRSVTSSEAVEHAVEDEAIVSEEIFVVSELEPVAARD